MSEYCGKEMTIVAICKNYLMEEDNSRNMWVESWFEKEDDTKIKHEPHPIFDNTKILGNFDVVKVETQEQLKNLIDWLNSELNGKWSNSEPASSLGNGHRYFNFFLENGHHYFHSWRGLRSFDDANSRVFLYEDLLLDQSKTEQPSEQDPQSKAETEHKENNETPFAEKVSNTECINIEKEYKITEDKKMENKTDYFDKKQDEGKGMTAEIKCPECLSAIDYDIRRKKIKDEFIEEDLINCPNCNCLLEVTTDIKIIVVRR